MDMGGAARASGRYARPAKAFMPYGMPPAAVAPAPVGAAPVVAFLRGLLPDEVTTAVGVVMLVAGIIVLVSASEAMLVAVRDDRDRAMGVIEYRVGD